MSMLLDRAWGKPKEYDPNSEKPTAALDGQKNILVHEGLSLLGAEALIMF
jgi:hypothetical protein